MQYGKIYKTVPHDVIMTKKNAVEVEKKWFVIAFIVGLILIYYLVYVQSNKKDAEKIDIAMSKFEQSKSNMAFIVEQTGNGLIYTYHAVLAWNKAEGEINQVEIDLETLEAEKELIEVHSFQEQLPVRRAEMTKAMTKRMDDRIQALREDYENAYGAYQRDAIRGYLNNHYGWRDEIIEQASYLGKGESIPQVTSL